MHFAAQHLLWSRHAVVARDQYASLLEMARDFHRINSIAAPTQRSGPKEHMVRLHVAVEAFGRLLLEFISLGEGLPSPAGFVDVDEILAETGHKLALNLACGPHDFTSGVEVAALQHPTLHTCDDPCIGFLDAPGQQFR